MPKLFNNILVFLLHDLRHGQMLVLQTKPMWHRHGRRHLKHSVNNISVLFWRYQKYHMCEERRLVIFVYAKLVAPLIFWDVTSLGTNDRNWLNKWMNVLYILWLVHLTFRASTCWRRTDRKDGKKIAHCLPRVLVAFWIKFWSFKISDDLWRK